MAKYITKFEFACEIFGYKNACSMNNEVIESYYKDWKSTTYSIKQYKSLLKSRG